MRKIQILILFFFTIALFPKVYASDIKLEQIDTHIIYISMNGLWQDGEKSGRYRLVVTRFGWEHTRSFIYLQWIQIDDKKRETIIVKSLPIEEFNKKDWRYFDSAVFQNSVYTIEYQNRGRETPQKATLVPGLPGKYSIDILEEPL